MTYSVVLLNGDPVGPVTIEELQDLASRGYLAADTMVRDEAGDEHRADALGLEFPPSVSASVETDPPQGEPPPSQVATPDAPTAKPFPWAAVAIGVAAVSVFGCIILAAILFPVFAQAKIAAKQTETLGRLKSVGQALNIYAIDFDDHFPPDMKSGSAVKPYLRTYSRDIIFESLNDKSKEFLGNAMLSGKKVVSVPDPANTMTLFDSADWSDKKRMTGLVDGSTRKVTSVDFEAATGRGFVLR